tara:strand:+ start:87 stop:1175 length:1089 start_codon:yes stop_codon:yes gene_type:complete
MKIAIIGAGKSGCISAIVAKFLSDAVEKNFEIEIYHDPSIPVNEGSVGVTYPIVKLLYKFHQNKLSFKDTENYFDATLKTGVLYQNWGKGGYYFHGDDGGSLMHFIPKKFSDYILGLKFFKVIEKHIVDPESEVDSDIIIDCRGRDESIKYERLINPITSSMSACKEGEDFDEMSNHIARPHGWILGIPNKKTIYYEYFYNNMSSKEDVISDFTEHLGISPNKYNSIDNYFTDNIFVGERTIINGSRFFSLEPLESIAFEVNQRIAISGIKYFIGLYTKDIANKKIHDHLMKVESILLWCYHSGSIYETDFWNYAKNLEFRDTIKDRFLELVDKCSLSKTGGNGVERMSSNIFLDELNKSGI